MRALLTVPRTEEPRFTAMLEARGVPFARVGVTGGDVLEVQGQFDVPLAELTEAWQAPLPARFA